MSMSSFCVICGEQGERVYICNGYTSSLCVLHSNTLEEWVIANGWLRRLHLLEKRRDALVMGYRGKELEMRSLMNATNRVDKYKDILYYKVKKWINEQENRRN